MVVNSRFTDVKYVTLLLQNITAGQSYILRSHFRKYILLGYIHTSRPRVTMPGCPFLSLPVTPCPALSNCKAKG